LSGNHGQKSEHRTQDLVIGGGIAGIVTALGLLDGGRTVLLLDADTEDRLGGLALWAFGGMALAGTREQRRMGVEDSPERLYEDWVRFGELEPGETWPLAWARCYAEESKAEVYDWLKALGLKFMPAVNLVERGDTMQGNSVPRYHILWGTGRELVQVLIQRLRAHPNRERLTILHGHRATGLDFENGRVTGCRGLSEPVSRAFTVRADNTIIATGGINGSVGKVREHWPEHWPEAPGVILNGANPLSDGCIHDSAGQIGAKLTRLEDMWNYAAGIPHPQPHFTGHGLSLVPCKTCLWLDPDGKPIGPMPMVTGFDTRRMCRQVADHPYTWQIVNYRILAKELAISGAEHNPKVVNHQFFGMMKNLLLGNRQLADQMLNESTEFLSADNWTELAAQMNALTGEDRIAANGLKKRADEFDAAMKDPRKRDSHPAVRRINKTREWKADRLRTCRFQRIADPKAGPLIAIRLHFLSRKSLGGLQTDLDCRVLDRSGEAMNGLYAVGEAAGFGGGGCSGKRSLEGHFLSSCVLTGRRAARAICGA